MNQDDRPSWKARTVSASGKPAGIVPVAALLFDPALRPQVSDIAGLSQRNHAFAVVHGDAKHGTAELLRDGVAFDCGGLAPAPQFALEGAVQRIALPPDLALDPLALVTLAPDAQVAGAARALPVTRMLAGLVTALASLPGAAAVVWLPARLAMPVAWFDQAVTPWLNGGPFPALALTALARSDEGLVSKGLAYFTGQEFVFAGKHGVVQESDARGAVRLTDWLVAHGRIDTACEVDLADFGTVRLDLQDADTVRAHKL